MASGESGKAWKLIDPDGFVFIRHAETRGKARMEFAREYDIEKWDAWGFRVLRCPAMDDLPATLYYAMATGVISSAEDGCPSCGIAFYADLDDEKKLMIYSVRDHAGIRVFKAEDDDDAYCSKECYQRWQEERQRSASGDAPFVGR